MSPNFLGGTLQNRAGEEISSRVGTRLPLNPEHRRT
jgi:hypothetical protein